MSEDLDKKKVLIIEDNPGIAELMKLVLEGENYQVIVCDNGQSALDLAAMEKPAVVFLDLWIPKINGEQVARMLKANLATKDAAIIITSAQRDLADLSQKIDADGYLTKPFDIDDLIAITKEHASRKN